MHKTYFHNNKFTDENTNKKESIQIQYNIQKRNVDINKLLNRVKENEKIAFNKKLTLLSLGTLVLCVFGLIISQ